MKIFFNPTVFEGAIDTGADVVLCRNRMESLKFSGAREEGTCGRPIYSEKERLGRGNGFA